MPSDERGITKDVHLGLRFWVEIDGVEVAGFSDCSGLSIESDMFEYAEGGWNVHTHKLPGHVKYGNITLRRGINPGHELFEWFTKGLGGTPAPRKSVTITIYSPDGKNVKQWSVREAYPVKWTGPDLKAESGSVAVETLEIAHHGLQEAPTRL